MSFYSKYLYLTRECVDLVASVLPLKKGISERQKVLIIKLDNIGDFILWLDSFRAYSQIFPPEVYDVTVLGNSVWEELARANLSVKEFLFIDPNRFCSNLAYRWKIFKQLRKNAFDIVVQTRFSRRYALEDAIIKLCGAHQRVGFESHSGSLRQLEEKRSRRWYSHLITTSLGDVHELQRNGEFVRALGAKDFKISIPELHISKQQDEKAKAIIAEDGIFSNYYVLFIGAAEAGKRWPPNRYIDIGKLLYKRYGWLGVICGGPEDTGAGEIILREADVPMRNLAGSTSLNVLAAVIKHAKLLVTNDTLAVHMAAALSIPCVCILGGGHFERFLPYPASLGTSSQIPAIVYKKMECFGCNWRCIHTRTSNSQPFPCVFNITVEMVWPAINTLLETIERDQQGI